MRPSKVIIAVFLIALFAIYFGCTSDPDNSSSQQDTAATVTTTPTDETDQTDVGSVSDETVDESVETAGTAETTETTQTDTPPVIIPEVLSVEKSAPSADGKTYLALNFTDAPIDDAKSVKVAIKRIEIAKEDEGFFEYFIAETEDDEIEIDLLLFRNGNSLPVDSKEMEPGEYGQIRFYLSDVAEKNTITLMDDAVHNLQINNGIKNNGLKLVSGFELQDGIETKLTIDFNVRKSIVVKGGKKNPKYALKPTIKLIRNDVAAHIVAVLNNITKTGELFYLYDATADVSNEAGAKTNDDNGTPDDPSDDSPIDQPFANAISSASSVIDPNDGLTKVIFSYTPYGTYDIYKYNPSTKELHLIKADVSLLAGGSVTVYVDDIEAPYNSSIVINDGAETTESTEVILSLSAEDVFGVSAYLVSEYGDTPSRSDEEWAEIGDKPMELSIATTFNLSEGVGDKTVYAWFKDETGTISGRSNDNIILNLVSAEIPVNGLVAYYPFNGSANDESGNGNHGSVNSATLSTDRFGNQNKAYSFDGIDDFIEVPDALELNFGSGDFSISLWFKLSDTESKQMLLHKSTFSSVNLPQYWIRVNGNDSYLFFNTQALGPSDYLGVSAGNIGDGETNWHNLTVTRSSETLNLYLNGQFITSSTGDFKNVTNSGSLLIGAQQSSEGSDTKYNFADGKIDDIRIYNRTLSLSEVMAIFSEQQKSSSGLLPDTGQSEDYSTIFGEDSDYSINLPSFSDNDDGTITDNNTGLLWQKDDDDVQKNWETAITYCTDLTLGGYSGWRLPNVQELQSIVDYGINYSGNIPVVNGTYFPNTKSALYWSSTVGAFNTERSWHVSFTSGQVDRSDKSQVRYVRCVQGDLSSSIWSMDFEGIDSEIIHHIDTGLTWQRHGDKNTRTWESAISYCENLSLAGYSDWRLPSIRELFSIVKHNPIAPSIDEASFPNTSVSNFYWSSTNNPFDTSRSWYVFFVSGNIGDSLKTNKRLARCVRGGRGSYSWNLASSDVEWGEKADFTSIEFDNKIWVIGGYSSGSGVHDDVWYSSDGITWNPAPSSAPRGIYGHTSVVFDNKIWLIGGSDSTYTRRNDVWYSSNGIDWELATDDAAWSARYGHTSVVFDNKIWVIGGTAGGFDNDVWYSSNGITWERATASASWPARHDHVSVAFDGKMWVLGGWRNYIIRDAWYSVDGSNWQQAPTPAWSARVAHAGVTFDGKMWVSGGQIAAGGPSSNEIWYSDDGVSWSKPTSNVLWGGRHSHAMAVFKDKIWVMAGGKVGFGYKDVWYME